MIKNKNLWRRILIYMTGLVVLALGITLNTKTDLGVSPIISVPFSISAVAEKNLSALIFLFYCFCVLLEWMLDRKGFRPADLLQIPMSFLTSIFIGLFDTYLPAAPDSLPIRFLLLGTAVALTGLGASLTVMMRLVPNPADALARVVGLKAGKNFGFGKNLLDLCCAAAAILIGALFAGSLPGIGAGTVIAVVFTGRAIAVTDRLFGKKLQTAAGLETQEGSESSKKSAADTVAETEC
ncbi:YczE/YyaS/YitT family protein [Bacilliculturomica massiliensis]|uniref:YczE/YyaS/YitT family protein n=1 Tax=Bacilliculturomica massiliensis TaxID=1917867 RepID=UPI0010322B95|nr:DUF6198 family protein [Bacilliculturomica massiliensis]